MKKSIRSLSLIGLSLGVVFVAPSIAADQKSDTKKTVAIGKNTERLFDFNFPNMEFKTVFRALSDASGVDIITSPKIDGKVVFRATQKTWQEALQILCDVYGFTWLVEDKYIYILTKEEYRARQINDADKELQYERIAPKVRTTYQLKHAKVEDLTAVITQLLTEGGGTVTPVPRNNALVVNASENKQAIVEKTLRTLDVEVKQVTITAQLVVVNSDWTKELGVDWSVNAGQGLAPTWTPKGATATDALGNTANRGVISNVPNGPGVAGQGLNMNFGLLQGALGMNIGQFLQEKNLEILANPQISTLDHMPARIFMGGERTIRVVDDNGRSANKQVQAGISLDVTPHVSGGAFGDRIMLELNPKNDEFEENQGNIQRQEAKTTVVVNDGETLVIGGLTSNKEDITETGIPFLKDIPLVGYLFKKEKKIQVKRNLVIFVTPHIVKSVNDGELFKQVNNSAKPSVITTDAKAELAPVEEKK